MTTEQRLERLERENRWMRRIGAVGVAVAATVFLIGQGKIPGTIEAREFVLRGDKGERLGSLQAGKKRWGLRLLDGAGNTVVSLAVVRPRGITYGLMRMCYSTGYVPWRADHTGRRGLPRPPGARGGYCPSERPATVSKHPFHCSLLSTPRL